MIPPDEMPQFRDVNAENKKLLCDLGIEKEVLKLLKGYSIDEEIRWEAPSGVYKKPDFKRDGFAVSHFSPKEFLRSDDGRTYMKRAVYISVYGKPNLLCIPFSSPH